MCTYVCARVRMCVFTLILLVSEHVCIACVCVCVCVRARALHCDPHISFGVPIKEYTDL